MKRSRLILSSALAASVVALTFAASGAAKSGHRDHHGKAHHGMGHGLRHLEWKLDRLELDADTEAAALEILEAAKPDRLALREQLRAAREELGNLIDVDVPSEAAVMAQADELGALSTEMDKLGLRTWLQVNALLEPEQRAELRSMKRRHAERRHERRGERSD